MTLASRSLRTNLLEYRIMTLTIFLQLGGARHERRTRTPVQTAVSICSRLGSIFVPATATVGSRGSSADLVEKADSRFVIVGSVFESVSANGEIRVSVAEIMGEPFEIVDAENAIPGAENAIVDAENESVDRVNESVD